VKAYGTWAIPLHVSSVLPCVQGRSRFADQNANRASWCAWTYRSMVWKSVTLTMSPVSSRPFTDEMPMVR